MSELASENVRRTLPIKYLIGILILVVDDRGGILYLLFCLLARISPLCPLADDSGHPSAMIPKPYLNISIFRQWLIIWWKNLPATLIRLLKKKGLGQRPEEDDVTRLMRSLTRKFARFIAPKILCRWSRKSSRDWKNICLNSIPCKRRRCRRYHPRLKFNRMTVWPM